MASRPEERKGKRPAAGQRHALTISQQASQATSDAAAVVVRCRAAVTATAQEFIECLATASPRPTERNRKYQSGAPVIPARRASACLLRAESRAARPPSPGDLSKNLATGNRLAFPLK